ncbi:hypothetical protein [Nitrosomonas sp.]|uniref:hypothetical protein n=1 Tax=Nitrosomonas sp. TaxID=42353 RepID=UPI0025ED2A2E|nr:hypothetical protein [Nitrosomonas sp.]
MKMCEQISRFDKNNKEIIYNLLVLKGESFIRGKILASYKEFTKGEKYSNFFLGISDQIDILLIYFINDEISASLPNRGPLIELCDEAINEYFRDENSKCLTTAIEDLKDLFANRTEFVRGSNIFDFKVNTFSVFEHYVVVLYEELTSTNPRSREKEQKLIKLIEDYNKEECNEKKLSLLKRIKDISFYISSSEKINYVLSRCKGIDSKKKDIRQLIDYYRNQRNTVHNLGIHKGESLSVTVKEGIEIELEKDKFSYTSDYNSAIFACRELMDIYETMHTSVTGEAVS